MELWITLYKRWSRPLLHLTRSVSAVLPERVIPPPPRFILQFVTLPLNEIVTEHSRLPGWVAVSIARQSQTFRRNRSPPHHSLCLDPEDGNNKFLRNSGNYLPIDTASYATWLQLLRLQIPRAHCHLVCRKECGHCSVDKERANSVSGTGICEGLFKWASGRWELWLDKEQFHYIKQTDSNSPQIYRIRQL